MREGQNLPPPLPGRGLIPAPWPCECIFHESRCVASRYVGILFSFLRAFCYGCWETGLLTSWIIPSFILRYRIYHRKRYYRNRASKHRDGTHRAAWKTHPRGIGPTFFSHLSHVSFTSSSISLRSSLDFDLGGGGGWISATETCCVRIGVFFKFFIQVIRENHVTLWGNWPKLRDQALNEGLNPRPFLIFRHRRANA